MSDENIRPDEEPAPAVGEGMSPPAPADGAAGSSPPSAPPGDALDQYLAEYDQATKLGLDTANPAAPEPSATDEFDRILNEPAPQPVDPATQQQFESRSRELQQLREQHFWREQDAAWDRVVSQDEKDLARDFPWIGEDKVRTWMRDRAFSNAQFRHAWFNQAQNPRAWKVQHVIACRELHKELARDEGLIAGRQVTEDRELVAASMKGANVGKVTADPPPNLGTMSDQEFRSYKSQFGF